MKHSKPQLSNETLSALCRQLGMLQRSGIPMGQGLELLAQDAQSPGERELLERLHTIEQAARRERLIHWGPRTLDLDILFYDDLVQDDPDLTLPHPDMQNRDFVLTPMAELAPHFVHPVFHKTIGQLLKELPKQSLDLERTL